MSRRRQRRGIVFFELLIALPVVAIFLAAVVEFALISINAQHISMACRMGAKHAAENPGSAAGDIKMVVDRYLEHSGFGAGASAGVSVIDSGAGSSSSSGTCTALSSYTTAAPSRKVRVCVALTTLTPNLLNVFGYDISAKTFQSDTVFPVE